MPMASNLFSFQNEDEKPHRGKLQQLAKVVLQYLDLKLVKEPIFLMMVMSVMTMSVGVPHVLFFVPTYTRNLKVAIEPAFLLSATSIAGRVCIPVSSAKRELRSISKDLRYTWAHGIKRNCTSLLATPHSFKR